MAQKPRATTDRSGIIERVTTPLGFFTLGILAIEGILASLSLRATGTDLTILIVGMLIGFALLCAMVFVLATSRQSRSALLGVTDYSPSNAIASMNLTENDIRVILFTYTNRSWAYHDSCSSSMMLLGDRPLPVDERLQKLEKLGLVRRHDGGHSLTEEGSALGSLIGQFSRAILELDENLRGHFGI